jgi:hypothetical protein
MFLGYRLVTATLTAEATTATATTTAATLSRTATVVFAGTRFIDGNGTAAEFGLI